MPVVVARTPNPEVLKFEIGRRLTISHAVFFAAASEAVESPLAMEIFALEGVRETLLGSDFLTVAKSSDMDWSRLEDSIVATIERHLQTPSKQLGAVGPEGAPAPTDDPIVREILDILETHVHPAVALDGGDIVFARFDEDTGVVWLSMRGACAGCPSSAATLKSGVENLLRHYVPAVTGVEALAD